MRAGVIPELMSLIDHPLHQIRAVIHKILGQKKSDIDALFLQDIQFGRGLVVAEALIHRQIDDGFGSILNPVDVELPPLALIPGPVGGNHIGIAVFFRIAEINRICRQRGEISRPVAPAGRNRGGRGRCRAV